MFKVGDKVLYSPWVGCKNSSKKQAIIESESFNLCGSTCVNISGVGAVDIENLELIEDEK